jgi:hypothetical protein
MRNGVILIFNICDTRRTLLPHASQSVKNPKSGSTADAAITIQWVTRGLFKRLDGVIAWPEETACLSLFFGEDQAALQLPRARYDW